VREIANHPAKTTPQRLAGEKSHGELDLARRARFRRDIFSDLHSLSDPSKRMGALPVSRGRTRLSSVPIARQLPVEIYGLAECARYKSQLSTQSRRTHLGEISCKNALIRAGEAEPRVLARAHPCNLAIIIRTERTFVGLFTIAEHYL